MAFPGFSKNAVIMKTIKETFRRHLFLWFCLFLCISLLVAFEIREYVSPLPARKWNGEKLRRIKVVEEDHFSFAVFGDNRNSRAVFEDLLKMIDHDPDIQFAIGLGDFVERGSKGRYRYFINQVNRNLGIPLLTAIGNHETQGKGREIYREVFGPFYYSFQLGKHYFIVLDTADREAFDLLGQGVWLEKELEKSRNYDTCFVFMHIPLYDQGSGGHKDSLSKKYADHLAGLFIKSRVTYVFASHIHGYFKGQWGSIPYTITGGAGADLIKDLPGNHFLKVTINKGTVGVQVKEVPSAGSQWMDTLSYGVYIQVDTFFRIHGKEIVIFFVCGGVVLIIFRSRWRNKKKPPRSTFLT